MPSAQASRQISPRAEQELRQMLELNLPHSSKDGAGDSRGRTNSKPGTSERPPDGTRAGPKMDSELMAMLREWDLEDAVDALLNHGCKSLKRLRKMPLIEISALGLPPATSRDLQELIETVKSKTEEPAAAEIKKDSKWEPQAMIEAVEAKIEKPAAADLENYMVCTHSQTYTHAVSLYTQSYYTCVCVCLRVWVCVRLRVCVTLSVYIYMHIE